MVHAPAGPCESRASLVRQPRRTPPGCPGCIIVLDAPAACSDHASLWLHVTSCRSVHPPPGRVQAAAGVLARRRRPWHSHDAVRRAGGHGSGGESAHEQRQLRGLLLIARAPPALFLSVPLAAEPARRILPRSRARPERLQTLRLTPTRHYPTASHRACW